MKNCPNCDEELDKAMVNAGVCDHCGEPLEEEEDEDLEEDEDDDDEDKGKGKKGVPRKPVDRPKGRR